MKYFYALVISIFSLTAFSQVTILEADIIPGAVASDPQYLCVYNGKLYFSAFDGAIGGGHGRELWSYDGATAQLVADIFPGGLFSSEPRDLYVYDSVLYFSAEDGVHGRELWAYNGDSAYLFKDIQTTSSNSGNSYPQYFTEYNGHLYFRAYQIDPGAYYGYELFATDGDSIWVIDIWPGSNSGNSYYLAVYNNKLFFHGGTNNNLGYELYSYNGDSVKLEADIFPGPSSSGPAYLTVAGNNLYFSASITGIGSELWKFDGTTATLVDDIQAGTGSGGPVYLTEYNGDLYFRAEDGITGREMWSYDGTTLTNWDLYVGSSSSQPRDLKVFNNTLYISFRLCANNYGLNCNYHNLISFDGDTFQNVTSNFENYYYPQFMTEFNGKLFFNAGSSVTGRELWSYSPDSLCIPPKKLSVTPENLNTVNLNWDLEPNAVGYEIRGTEVGTGGFVTITVNGGTTSYKAKGLFSNKTYAWQVKSICDVGFESDYSAFDTFKIDDFYCQMPTNYVTDITPTSAVLRWNVIVNAERYWIIGRDVNSSKIRSLNIYDGEQDSVWVQLAPGNTYAWQMRAECPAAPNVSFFTPVQFFSTPTNKVLVGGNTEEISIGPNPMVDHTVITSEEEITEVMLMDLQGRIIRSDETSTLTYSIDRGNLASGIYYMVIRTSENEFVSKVVVQ